MAENKLDFYSALQVVAAGNIFTTHTPVPAGNDAFPLELMRKYFGDYPAQSGHRFRNLRQLRPDRADDPHEPFSMTILALRTSRHANGVSALHGQGEPGPLEGRLAGVPTERGADHEHHQRRSYQNLDGPGIRRPLRQVSARLGGTPHGARFLARGVSTSRTRRSGRPTEAEGAARGFRPRARAEPARTARRNARRRSAHVSRLLNPEVLTIGFARRFATYKRATLLF